MLDDCMVLVDFYLDRNLVRNIKNIFLSNLFFDISIKTKFGSIKAHKLVLAASSKYFRVLFTTDLKSDDSCVDLKFLDACALENVINYFYTGEIKLSETNLASIMEVEDALCIGSLRPLLNEAAASFLQESVSWAWSLWPTLEAFGYKDLAEAAFEKVRANFASTLSDEDAFAAVPFELLDACLASRHLNAPPEDQLLKGLVGWLTSDLESRREYVEPLLARVDPRRLETTRETLRQVAESFVELGQESTVKDWIERALSESQLIPAEENRYYEKTTNVIFVIGGNCDGRARGSVECLPDGHSSWRSTLPTYIYPGPKEKAAARVIASLNQPRSGAAACSSASQRIYVVGGQSDSAALSSVEVFSCLDNRWEFGVPLPAPRLKAAAVHTNGALYLSGGLDTETGMASKSLMVLNDKSKSWRHLPDMIYNRCEHCLVAVDGILYAIGGFDINEKPLKSVERYDPSCETWLEVAPMWHTRAKGGAAAIGHHIYVIGGTSHLRDSEESCFSTHSRDDEALDRITYYERFDTLHPGNGWEPVCVAPSSSSWQRVRSVKGVGGACILSTTGSVSTSLFWPSGQASCSGPALIGLRADAALVSATVPVHASPPL